MVWALLAILGVPIWLIAGLLVGIVLHRRSFKNQPGVFPCSIRDEGATKWPRMQSYARQIRGVFVVNNGAAMLRSDIHAVDAVSSLVLGAEGPKRLADPVGRLITLDDGSRIEVAVSRADIAHLDALTN